MDNLPTFKAGERYDPLKIQKIADAVDRNQPQGGGLGVRINRTPDGFTQTFRASNTLFVPPVWRVSMQGTLENLSITIGRGLVNGVEPVITNDKGVDIPISGAPGTNGSKGPVPQLPIPKTSFDLKAGQGMLYLRADMTRDWILQSVTAVPFAAKPAFKAFSAFKLLGFFVISGSSVMYQQMCFFNLGLGTLFDRRPSGTARYVWYAAG